MVMHIFSLRGRPWRWISYVLITLLTTCLQAAPTRVAVIYSDQDEQFARDIKSLLASMESVPDIEVLRLDINRRPSVTANLLLAAAQTGAPLRLAASGITGPIAVLYPDIGEPYRSVFTKIIEGIEDKTRSRVASFAVGSNFNAQELSGELRKQEVKVVIALGRNGFKAASGLEKEINVVVGGVVALPDTESRTTPVLSLAPDPALLFSRLKSLAPTTRRVLVVFDPKQNAWLIRLARDAARNQGIELVTQEASDLKAALHAYQEFLNGADPKRDAIWLPQDSTTVEESTVLPLVLQETWSKNIPLFSSSVAHVKRGALFALYPNNVELGRNLASSALGIASGTPNLKGIVPLRDVLTAFNTRTASHLGLGTSATQQGFDLLFPEQ